MHPRSPYVGRIRAHTPLALLLLALCLLAVGAHALIGPADAATRSLDAQQEALKLGCKAVYSSISEATKHNLDVIVVFASAGTTTADAIEAVRPGGRVVLVGMAKLETTINTMTLITHEVTLVGSQGGNADDIAAVYEMMASGDLKAEIIEIGFEEIGEGLERSHAGGVKGRLVAMMDR